MDATKLIAKPVAKLKEWSKEVKRIGLKNVVLEKAYNVFFSYKLKKTGVHYPDLSGNVSETNKLSVHKDSIENHPTSFRSLFKAFKHIPLQHNAISLLDIGSGSGRVLNFGMLQHFKEVAGVELDDRAIKMALSNCLQLKKLGYQTPFSIQNCDAIHCNIPGGVNTIYLYNPFGEKTLKDVVSNIINYSRKSRQVVFIIYTWPEFREVLDRHEKIKMIFESRYERDLFFEMAIYKTVLV